MYTNMCIQQDGHCAYLRNIGVRSRNTCCRGKEVSHILSVCSLRHPAYKEHAPYYMAMCGLSGCTEFPHLMNGTIFRKKKTLLGIQCLF